MGTGQYGLFGNTVIVAKRLKATDLEWLAAEGVRSMVACSGEPFYTRLFDVARGDDAEGVKRALAGVSQDAKCIVHYDKLQDVAVPLCLYLMKERGVSLKDALVGLLTAMPAALPDEQSFYYLGIADYNIHGTMSVSPDMYDELRSAQDPHSLPQSDPQHTAARRLLYLSGSSAVEGITTPSCLLDVFSAAMEAAPPSFRRAYSLGFSHCANRHASVLAEHMLDVGLSNQMAEVLQLLTGDARKVFDESAVKWLKEMLLFGKRGEAASLRGVLHGAEDNEALASRVQEVLACLDDHCFGGLKRMLSSAVRECMHAAHPSEPTLRMFSKASWGDVLQSDAWVVPHALSSVLSDAPLEGKTLTLLPAYGTAELRYGTTTVTVPTPCACILLALGTVDSQPVQSLQDETGIPPRVFRPALSLLLNFKSPKARQPILLLEKDIVKLNPSFAPTTRKLDMTRK